MKLNTTVSSCSSLIAVYLCMASGNVYAQDAATDAANSSSLPDQEEITNTETPTLDTSLPTETVSKELDEAEADAEADANAGFVDSDEGRNSTIPKIGAGFKLSSLGLGIDVAARITPKINVRLNLNKLDYDFDDVEVSDETSLEETTEGSLAMSNHGLLLDYHPFAGTFRVSFGIYSSSNKVNTLTTGSIEDTKIGDYRYDIEGEVVGSAKMNGTLPYIGLGWGNTPRDGFPLSVSFDLGVLIGTDATAEVDVTGTATELSTGIEFDINDEANPEAERFHTQLQNEIDEINSDLSDVSMFPVISFGLNYRFN